MGVGKIQGCHSVCPTHGPVREAWVAWGKGCGMAVIGKMWTLSTAKGKGGRDGEEDRPVDRGVITLGRNRGGRSFCVSSL